jgi:hypothetical protein
MHLSLSRVVRYLEAYFRMLLTGRGKNAGTVLIMIRTT